MLSVAPVVEIIVNDKGSIIDGSKHMTNGCGPSLMTPTKCQIMTRREEKMMRVWKLRENYD